MRKHRLNKVVSSLLYHQKIVLYFVLIVSPKGSSAKLGPNKKKKRNKKKNKSYRAKSCTDESINCYSNKLRKPSNNKLRTEPFWQGTDVHRLLYRGVYFILFLFSHILTSVRLYMKLYEILCVMCFVILNFYSVSNSHSTVQYSLFISSENVEFEILKWTKWSTVE